MICSLVAGDYFVDPTCIPIALEPVALKIVEGGKHIDILRQVDDGLAEAVPWLALDKENLSTTLEDKQERTFVDLMQQPERVHEKWPLMSSTKEQYTLQEPIHPCYKDSETEGQSDHEILRRVSSWVQRCQHWSDEASQARDQAQGGFLAEDFAAAAGTASLKSHPWHAMLSNAAAQIIGLAASPSLIDKRKALLVAQSSREKVPNSQHTANLNSVTHSGTIDIILRKELYDPVLRILAIASYRCARVFMTRLRLEMYLKLCSALFLLREPILWAWFLDKLFSTVSIGLPRPPTSVMSNLEPWRDDHLVSAALRDSILSGIHEKLCSRTVARGLTHIPSGTDVAPIERLRIALGELLSASPKDGRRICTDLTCFHSIVLEWDFHWPLSLLLTPNIIERYNTLFVHLLQISFVQGCIEDALSDGIRSVRYKCLQNQRNTAKDARVSCRLLERCMTRSLLDLGRMRQFVRSLAWVLKTQIHCNGWKGLQRRLNSCASLDELHSALCWYLSYLEKVAGLSRPLIDRALQQVLDYIALLPQCCALLEACLNHKWDLEDRASSAKAQAAMCEAVQPLQEGAAAFDATLTHLIEELAQVRNTCSTYLCHLT
jgi:hypothetical protein